MERSREQGTEASAAEIVVRIRSKDRVALAQAITLVESEKESHRDLASAIVRGCLESKGGGTLRIGISGPPGVGKSTFIEAFGIRLCDAGHQVAVLTVDPSSEISGGSILGDKTRMTNLARREAAFIRPSPSRGTLGGVTGKCQEVILLCESAGYDRILVETVGVGQSEVGVRAVVDFFLLLQLAGAGDAVQGIKKGIMEMADALVVTKADGENMQAAEFAAEGLRQIVPILRPYHRDWSPAVLECSAQTGRGMSEVLSVLESFRLCMTEGDRLDEKRQGQAVDWFRRIVKDEILRQVLGRPDFSQQMAMLEEAISNDSVSALDASEQLMALIEPGI